MSSSPAASAIYRGLFSDPPSEGYLSDDAEVAAMVAFEGALARVQGALGLIPPEAARRIAEVTQDLVIEPAALAEGTASSGVPIPALVGAIRTAVGGDAARYVHWGATSQDVVDTALVLRLRGLLGLFDERLAALEQRLAALARDHRTTVLAGRTRSQQATPIGFGLKIGGWLAPLPRIRRRLAELRGRVLQVQLGGASGNLAAMGDRGVEVMDALARELSLASPAAPWHTQRDGIAELAGWLALVTGALGKIGLDLLRLAQSEVGEARPGAGGGSSTMPQKSNPVAAEILVALARHNASLLGGVYEAMLQEHERDGVGWSQEWLALGPMLLSAGAALGHAEAVVGSIVVDPDRMAENLERSNGLVLAESAVFALAAHMPRIEAEALVKAGCTGVAASGRHLVDVLGELTEAPIDWARVRDPSSYLGGSELLLERILSTVTAREPPPE